ncbi:hypothetical protein Ddye_016522 [Dipteronia dyeriana]|uniref:Protein FAR1-RELATED SEQUENCE n=1 Tax=Dipteronia dyeriana TaxID=168575 RepID=A0AAD9U7K1_9ROSI|nr:hypothetical protein Ddye_016522 [Dipteronia dyeriana]
MDEDLKPTDTSNKNEWPFHVTFSPGNVSSPPSMNCDNLGQPIIDVVDSDHINLQVKDIMGKEFISVTDAKEFYKKFSKKFSYVTGFRMCKDRLCRDTYGLITIRRLVCSKEGYRSKKNVKRTDRVRGHRGQTRDGFRAAFKINFDKEKMLWVVTEFANHHCHKLLSDNHSQFQQTHQHVQDCDVAQVQSLRSVGAKTTQVMDHLLDQSGSYAVAGHTRKDLQNQLNSLLIFVGVKNHMKTTVFLFGLVVDETADTYTWILQTLLEAMNGKCPISVVTDGDRAMSMYRRM